MALGAAAFWRDAVTVVVLVNTSFTKSLFGLIPPDVAVVLPSNRTSDFAVVTAVIVAVFDPDDPAMVMTPR